MNNNLNVTITATDKLSATLDKIASNVNKAKSQLEGLNSNSALSKIENNAKKLNTNLSKSPGLLSQIGSTAGKVLGIFLGFKGISAIFNTISSSISKAFSRLDTMELFSQKMLLITGDSRNGAYALDELRKATKGTAYMLDTTAQAVQNFVTRGMDTQKATESVKIWMNAVSAYGRGTNEQFSLVMDAIAKMRTKGTVEMRYLNRLFNAGINPVRMYAQAMGMAETDVQASLTKKTLRTEEFLSVVEDVLQNGTDGIRSVATAAKEFAGTWEATFNNMKAAMARGWADLISEANDLFGENTLKGLVKGFGNGVENVLSGASKVIKVFRLSLTNLNAEFEKRHTYQINLNEQKIIGTFTRINQNIKETGEHFKYIFNSEGSFKILDEIRLKWLKLKETWAGVLEAISEGFKTIADPLAKFAVTYLGMTIDGVENLGQAFGEWLKLKIPGFFEKLRDLLYWLVDNADTIKSTVSTMIKAFVGFKVLQGVSGSITHFADSVNKLKESFNGFTMVADKFTKAKNKLFNSKGSSVVEDIIETSSPKNTVKKAVSTSVTENVTTKVADAVKPKSENKTYNNAYDYLKNYNKPSYYPELSKESKTTEKPFYQKYLESYNQPGYYGNNKNTVSSDKKSKSNVNKSLFETKDVYTSNNGVYDYVKNYNKPDHYKTTEKNNGGIYDYLKNYNNKDFYSDNSKDSKTSKISEFFTKIKGKGKEVVKDPVGSTKKGFFNFVDKVKDTGKSVKNSQFVEGVGGMAKTSAGWIKEGVKDNSITKGISKIKDSPITEKIGGFAQSAVGFIDDNVISKAVGGIKKIGPIFTEFFTSLMDTPFFGFIQSAISWVSSFASAFLGAVPMLTVFSAGLGAVVAGLGLLNPGNTVSEGINSFFDNFGEKCNNFTENAVSMIQGFGEKLRASFPTLIQQGVNLILSLVNGLFVGLPNLIGAAGSLIMNFLGELFTCLPTIVQGGFDAVCQFIEGILSPESLSNIVGAVGNMISTLFTAIVTNIPKMITGGIKLVIGIVTGLGKMIFSLGKALLNLIVSGWNYFWENKDQIWENIKNFGSSIVNWIKDGIKGAWDGFCNWFSDLFNWGNNPEEIVDNSNTFQVGEQIDNNVQEGIEDNAPEVSASGEQMVQDTVDDTQEMIDNSDLDASSLGMDFTDSYASGIEGGSEAINQAFAQIAQLGGDSLGNYEATQQIGQNYVQSFIQGITDKQEDLYLKTNDLAFNCMEILKGALLSYDESLPEDMANKFLEVTEKVIGYVNTMCVGVEKEISNHTMLTEGQMLTMRDVIESYFRLAMENSLQAVKDGAPDILDQFEKLKNDIDDKMSELGTIMKAVGETSMTEFKSGIDSKMQDVLDSAGSLVQQLKKTFTDGLGIHSPSRVMYGYGANTAEGFINGLNSEQITKFTENIINDMRTSFANGKFNPFELVNFLSDDETIALVGYLSNLDTSSVGVDSIAYPLVGTMGTISSYFGHRASPGGIGSTNHGGIDIAAPTGTPIASSLAGTIVQAGWNGGYGKSVTVDHGNGTKTLYGHMSEVLSQVGQAVTKGQTIGLVGSTGNSTGPHVHYEVHLNGQRTDPLPYLQGAGLMGGDPLAIAIMNALNSKNGVAIASAFGASGLNGGFDANVARWSSVASQALAMLGQSQGYLNDVLWMIQGESGGDPFDVNTWDSNFLHGDPSKGLVQTIGATFRAYRNPNLSANIFDPLSNIYAGLNYAIHRYGSLENLFAPRRQKWYGYEVGTRYVPSDMLAMIHEGEAIIPKSQNPYSQSGGDYLGDMVEGALESKPNGVTGDIDAQAIIGSNESGTSMNGDIIFNNTFTSDVDADRFIGNLETELHKILMTGKNVTSAR